MRMFRLGRRDLSVVGGHVNELSVQPDAGGLAATGD